jgi:hypothetical protein
VSRTLAEDPWAQTEVKEAARGVQAEIGWRSGRWLDGYAYALLAAEWRPVS